MKFRQKQKFKKSLPDSCYKTMNDILTREDFSHCDSSMEVATKMYECMYLEALAMTDYIDQLEEDNQKLLMGNADMITILKTKEITLPESVIKSRKNDKRSDIQEESDARVKKSELIKLFQGSGSN